MSAPAGAAHHSAKITEEQVREIKQLLAASVRQVDIAERFGVDRTTITMIHIGRTWKHVGDPGREPVECAHNGIHKHGTIPMYRRDACRCDLCRGKNAEMARERTRMIAYGRQKSFVPAEPVRKHLLKLRACGISPARVTELSGVSDIAQWRILGGDRKQNKVRWETEQAILAIQPDFELSAASASIDGAGTRRRVEALIAIGWSQTQVWQGAGIGWHTAIRILQGDRVRVTTARAVADFYERMWDRPAPAGRHRACALRMARERRYYPPLAWDDDEIDDPAAKPHGEWRAVA
jgi:hypothetical protein